jgi:hypothetical protein
MQIVAEQNDHDWTGYISDLALLNENMRVFLMKIEISFPQIFSTANDNILYGKKNYFP